MNHFCVCFCMISSIDSQLYSVIAMEIEVKGSTEPYQILLEPYAVIIPGEIFVCTPTRRQFKVLFLFTKVDINKKNK